MHITDLDVFEPAIVPIAGQGCVPAPKPGLMSLMAKEWKSVNPLNALMFRMTSMSIRSTTQNGAAATRLLTKGTTQIEFLDG